MSEAKKDQDIPPRRRIEDDIIKNDPEDTGLAQPPGANERRLPHERDEAAVPNEPEQGPRQVIEQAKSDLERGLRDTERRGVPSDVPSPGAPPERSPGAEVPTEGVDPTHYGKHQKTGAQPPAAEGEGDRPPRGEGRGTRRDR